MASRNVLVAAATNAIQISGSGIARSSPPGIDPSPVYGYGESLTAGTATCSTVHSDSKPSSSSAHAKLTASSGEARGPELADTTPNFMVTVTSSLPRLGHRVRRRSRSRSVTERCRGQRNGRCVTPIHIAMKDPAVAGCRRLDSGHAASTPTALYGRAMRWGLSVSLAGELADPAAVAAMAAVAEAAGWDGVFVWDHLWNRTGAPFADPFVTLAAIAAATRTVRIGTMVAALPRRRPQLVAQAATSLDRLSGGRMILGLGLGVDSYGEFSAFDEPAADDRARGRALDTGIDALLPMLAGRAVPGAGGRTTTVPGVQQPRLPIWIAARTGRSAGPRRVNRHGLEGLALVNAEVWTPQHVADALGAGVLAAGSIDVILVGGTHPFPDALADAGTTWCMPEILPGATLAEAMETAGTPPH